MYNLCNFLSYNLVDYISQNLKAPEINFEKSYHIAYYV